MINWNEIKFRASSWGNLLTEPATKAAKEAGELSKTCQAELIKIYVQEIYDRKEDIITAAMDKGKQVEDEAIRILSMVDGEMYSKNQEPHENEWFTGHPDIVTETEVHDIKSSWSIFTFLPKMMEEPDKAYVAQLNCYYSLTGAQGGAICYVLASAPIGIIESEKRKLLFSMNVISEFSPEYLKAAEILEKNMVYEDIPLGQRVIKKYIPRDEELIQKMKDKVPRLREWLQEFDKIHRQSPLEYVV